MRYLLDTCVIVDHLRGYVPARQWLDTYPGPGEFTYSAVTLAELLSGRLGDEEARVNRLTAGMHFSGVDRSTACMAGKYVRVFRPSHGLEIPDAMIAATAWRLGIPLVTRDARHFPMTDIEVIVPYS